MISVGAIVLASALALPARLPVQGVVVPGTSLGGVHLGATRAAVRAAWGTTYGRCRGCRDETWYFTYRKFTAQGAGVSFRSGRVVALFTLWAPPGWRTSRGPTTASSRASR